MATEVEQQNQEYEYEIKISLILLFNNLTSSVMTTTMKRNDELKIAIVSKIGKGGGLLK